MRLSIGDIVRTDTRVGRVFDLSVLVLIIASVLMISIETLPGLSNEALRFFAVSEAVITVVFTLEYVTRVAAAKRKRAYVLSFHGVVDLLAILPFWLSLGIDLRALRIFRIFRVFRVLKLNRYSRAMETFVHALRQSRGQFFVFFVAISILLYLSAMGIYYFEHDAQPDTFKSVFHSLWWAVTTLTTVGYGDVYPITAGGRIFASLIVLLSLGVVAAPAGIIAAALTQAFEDLKH